MAFAAPTGWALPDPVLKPEFYADTATKRAIAWGIDSILIAIVCLLLAPFTLFIALLFWPIVYLVVGFLYRSATLASGSATLGMRLMAIELRGHDGGRLEPGFAVLHSVGYTISVFMVLPQVISAALMLTTPRGQGLTDLVLGTAAVNRMARR